MSTIYSHLSDIEKGEREDSQRGYPIDNSTISLAGIKVAVGFAFFLSLLALVGSFILFQTVGVERAKRETLEKEQLRLREKADRIERESEVYRSEIERMRIQLKSYASSRRAYHQELESSQLEISDLRKKVRQIGNIETNLEGSAAVGSIGVTPKLVPSMLNDVGTFDEASKAIEDMVLMADEMKTPKGFGADGPQVMTVNRKFNFIVVNIGLQSNLKIGDRMIIERNGEYIGTAEVEKLYDKFTAATILKESQDMPIQEGDTIRRF